MSKLLKLRREDSCADCKTTIAAGESAHWYATERVVRCHACGPSVIDSERVAAVEVMLVETTTTVPVVLTEPIDVAGGSAQREYDKRSARESAKKEQRVAADADWRKAIKSERPVLGRIASALTAKPQITPESQPTQAWKVGAEGERRVAHVLAEASGIEVLHDRLVPGSRANIDHIAIGPSGVFVIDAKKYKGPIEVRNVGGLFRVDERLYVNGRDRSKLAEGVLGQVDVVRAALGDGFAGVAVRGVLCFIGCEWGWIMRMKRIKGVTALWPAALAEHVAVPGDHRDQVREIADHLRRQLRSAT
jgi:hypothetical protein